MIKTEVRGCPFCGAEPTIEFWHGGPPSKRMIHCENEKCHVNPQTTGRTLDHAVENWNYRATEKLREKGKL